jgi:hypothetical protein
MARKNSATGRIVASNGYVMIWKPEHPDADIRGYIYEHRLVAEEKIGRRLLPTEIVHHEDGKKQNNSPANISVLHRIAEHRSMHRSASSNLKPLGAENPMRQCECGCGAWFFTYDKLNRPRKFISGHNRRGGKNGH